MWSPGSHKAGGQPWHTPDSKKWFSIIEIGSSAYDVGVRGPLHSKQQRGPHTRHSPYPLQEDTVGATFRPKSGSPGFGT